MATIDELSAALVKADAAGNAADAKALADAIRQMRVAAPSSGIPAGRAGVNMDYGFGGAEPPVQPQQAPQRGFFETVGAPINAVSQGLISAGGNVMFGGQNLLVKDYNSLARKMLAKRWLKTRPVGKLNHRLRLRRLSKSFLSQPAQP